MKNAWLLRPSPHNILRIKEFLDEGIIAIGWPELTSLKNEPKDAIKSKLSNHPLNYTKVQLGLATSAVNSFVNEMKIDDVIVVPDKSDIYFFKITSDYFYDPSKASLSLGYPHQRKALLIKGPVSRDSIPLDLRKSISAPKMLANLSSHIKLIDSFINASNIDSISFIDVNYPIRSNVIISVRIPNDMTQAEAVKFSEFVKTLYF